MSRVFLKYVDNTCTTNILGYQLRSRGWVFENIQLVRSGRMQDARFCNAYVGVWDDDYAAYMALELNNAFIPGVGTVQAEVARPRNNATAGTSSKASPAAVPSVKASPAAVPLVKASPAAVPLVPRPPKCPPPAHLLPAAKVQAAPMPMGTPPMVEVTAPGTMENPPTVEVPTAAAVSMEAPPMVEGDGSTAAVASMEAPPMVEGDGYDEEEIGDEELQRFKQLFLHELIAIADTAAEIEITAEEEFFASPTGCPAATLRVTLSETETMREKEGSKE
ncbi:unnamed protein product [Symbiodinium sp. CCMP2592]|nr:unnamed protein product [Symbiodinium sp. CCMP2592]